MSFYLITIEGVDKVEPKDTNDMDAMIIATVVTNETACERYGAVEGSQLVTLVDEDGVMVA